MVRSRRFDGLDALVAERGSALLDHELPVRADATDALDLRDALSGALALRSRRRCSRRWPRRTPPPRKTRRHPALRVRHDVQGRPKQHLQTGTSTSTLELYDYGLTVKVNRPTDVVPVK